MNLFYEIKRKFLSYLPWGLRNKKYIIEDALIKAIAEVMEKELRRIK